MRRDGEFILIISLIDLIHATLVVLGDPVSTFKYSVTSGFY
jgi:hypothetical protein